MKFRFSTSSDQYWKNLVFNCEETRLTQIKMDFSSIFNVYYGDGQCLGYYGGDCWRNREQCQTSHSLSRSHINWPQVLVGFSVWDLKLIMTLLQLPQRQRQRFFLQCCSCYPQYRDILYTKFV